MAALLLIVITSFFTAGLIVRTKSLASGRKGPGVFQPWKNVLVLLRKGIVYSETSGIISRIAPVIVFASIAIASLMIPVAGFKPLLSFNGDFILFAYLMALARFMMIIASFDSGSSFEGMGASREALYGMLIEPALFVIIAGLVIFTGQFSLSTLFDLPGEENYNLVYGLIISYIIGNITLIENSRVPVDDPKTHLELTMIHEGMILEQSGRNLALMELSSAIKMTVLMALLINLIVPFGLTTTLSVAAILIAVIVFTIKGSILAGIIGLFESSMAKKRFFQLPSLFAMAFFFSTLIIIIKVFS